jgi:hypothetical protein
MATLLFLSIREKGSLKVEFAQATGHRIAQPVARLAEEKVDLLAHASKHPSTPAMPAPARPASAAGSRARCLPKRRQDPIPGIAERPVLQQPGLGSVKLDCRTPRSR